MSGDHKHIWRTDGMHQNEFCGVCFASKPEHKDKCGFCDGTGWREAIDGWRDGSHVTARPCPRCGGDGKKR